MKEPDKIRSYFKSERLTLIIVAVTGIIYNIGMIAAPFFEGQLAQMLYGIIEESKAFSDMLKLAVSYVLVILFVQLLRYIKRFYVRRFANNVKRNMKHSLYSSLVHRSRAELERDDIGSIMTKAVSDVDACAEGMRKFTTEIFDTGVMMTAYLTMLFIYDARLALICCIFPPFSYLIAEKLKKRVALYAAACKESAGMLNGETLDRVSGSLTYRTLGVEAKRNEAYEKRLDDYEKKAARAGIIESALQPLYQIISMTGVVFVVWLGAENVLGNGFTAWDIAAFTTFLSCFAKLAVKSSKAAKLFNAVQKAGVSWERIKPLMKSVPEDKPTILQEPKTLCVKNLSFAYSDGKKVLDDISFFAKPGEIIGITGEIACGKSTLGKALCRAVKYSGQIFFGDTELYEMSDDKLCGTVSYMGHDMQLISATISENILLGDRYDLDKYLKIVCMDREVAQMPDGADTKIGSGGIRLSGGQQSRIALARTLCHKRPLVILDDPFSALDRATEKKIMENMRFISEASVVIIISHRLYLFPTFDRIIFMKNGRAENSTHKNLMASNEQYRKMYLAQTGGSNEKK